MFAPSETDQYICAIADPATKGRVASDLQSRAAECSTLVYPLFILGADCRLGAGRALPSVVLATKATLGSFVTILPGVRVGDRAVVRSGAIVTKNVPAGRTVFRVPAKLICTRAAK